jgi:hypothetical protein
MYESLCKLSVGLTSNAIFFVLIRRREARKPFILLSRHKRLIVYRRSVIFLFVLS